MGSFYHVGGCLPIETPDYVVRQADQELYESIKNGEFCYVLNARQMGKSSLKVRTMQQLQSEGYACASIDITAIGTTDISLEQWYAGMIYRIGEDLGLEDCFDVDDWWVEKQLLSVVQRFSLFLEAVVLAHIPAPIVIFIDEIDSILSLSFPLDDFFAAIRACYNARADHPEYQRLTFVIIGVTTPSELIQDRSRTPFNIGKAIPLTGFTPAEAAPLQMGLAPQAAHPEAVLREILAWTGGQPFLTQKICRLVTATPGLIRAGQEGEAVAAVVRQRVIDHWEVQDEPEHLKTIRDRLLQGAGSAQGRLLALVQQLLSAGGGLAAADSPEQMHLRLTGLVVKDQGHLRVFNPVYGGIFTPEWVAARLAELRPPIFTELFKAWQKAVPGEQPAFLLRGQGLTEVEAWAQDKRLHPLEEEFLRLSRTAERTETLQQLAWEQKERLLAEQQRDVVAGEAKILTQAKEKAERWVRFGAGILLVTVVAALTVGEIMRRRTLQQVTRAEVQLTLVQAKEALLNHYGIEAMTLVLTAAHRWQKYGDTAETQAVAAALQRALHSVDERNRLEGHSNSDLSAAWSADGARIITASDDRTARVWSAQGRLLLTLAGHDKSVRHASFSPDGQRMATASEDGTVRIWDRQGRLQRVLRGHQGVVWWVSFRPDGAEILTAGDDRSIRVWNRQGEVERILTGHGDSVRSAVFDPQGRGILSASKDGTARLWPAQGAPLILRGHRDWVRSAEFSPDGQTIITASRDGTARLWNRQGQRLGVIQGSTNQMWSARFSPDGQRIITANNDGTAQVWSRQGAALLTLSGHRNAVRSASFSPDGRWILTGGDDGTARIWRTRRPLLAQWVGHQAPITSVAWHPQGTLVTAAEDGTVRWWRDQGQLLKTLTYPGAIWRRVSVSPDGTNLLVTSENQGAYLLNSLGQTTFSLPHPAGVWAGSFRPDGQAILTGADDGVGRLWNLQGQLEQTFTGHQGWVRSATFSPDGQFLLTAGEDRNAHIWNAQGEKVQQLTGHQGWVRRAVYSPDGTHILTASRDGTARLWHPQGAWLSEFKGHQLSLWDGQFNPDGTQVITASEDRTARVWTLAGHLLYELQGHQDSVQSAAFSPDGQKIVTVSRDRRVRIWPALPIATDLKTLISQTCLALQDYLRTNPNASPQTRQICSKDLGSPNLKSPR
ncbi:WD40 repeat-containing protein [Gloeomargarita lithophora Alchichica-D10]|uniref:WD40 repeat-containing protein n=1 Tax=Gloeomargarita lithophora Alchichica-D10 TaxID=1188229 RepID=A0A1J0AD91_9CYAN|nr:AAA-like domain-containing protein [Gloeomargarita lithophora]APB33906.1 WD40 repeat-containing protein [Gloeomargarita lithophora Alchichica-D10]